jgi:transcriptional regulator with XRE-family HTH domain
MRRRRVIDLRFKDRLATLMIREGVVPADLAERVPVNRGYLSQILNGHRMPSADMAASFEAILNATPGELTGLVNLCALADDLDPLTAAFERPAGVGPEGVAAFQRVLTAQRHLEDQVGSAAVLAPVLPQLDTIRRMVRATTGPHRPALMDVAGQWAQFAGWLYTSLGQWNEARDWNRTALEWATEADSPELTATVLSYQAHVSWLTLDPGPTIGLSHAALRDRTVYPGQRAYDCFQAAKAHAYAGDVTEAHRYVAAGDEIAAGLPSWVGPVPAWQYYRAPWLWDLERGLVHLYLDRWTGSSATAAAQYLRAGLAAMPEHMKRSDWSAEYMAYLAAAYIRAGATTSARDELAAARDIAEATRSKRILTLVAARERQLRDIA